MKNKMELPINTEHHMRSSTTMAGLYSIMASKEYTGELNAIISKLAIFSDENYVDYFNDSNSFIQSLENIRMDFDDTNKVLKFNSHPYVENKYAYVYKNVEIKNNSCNRIEVKIDYIQDSNAWSNIKILLSNGRKGYNEEFRELSFEDECSLKLTSWGELVFRSSVNRKYIRLQKKDLNSSILLRLELGTCIKAEYSFNGIDWIVISETEYNKTGSKEIGLYVCPKVNPFFYDFYVSQIQLCFSRVTKVLKPHADTEERYFTNMLEVYHIPREAIALSDTELIHYYTELLSKGYYIRLRLNEFFVQERRAYKKFNFPHTNYIYGYDKTRQTFKLMGFNIFFGLSEISFDDFITAHKHEKVINSKIMFCKYNSRKYPDSFNLDAVITNLKAYVNGHNSFSVTSDKTIVINSNMPFLYGIKIYEAIAGNVEYMDNFIKDVRLSHQILEHNLNILKMLEFMNCNKVISDEDYKDHLERFHDITQICEAMKTLVIKNNVKAVTNVGLELKNSLINLKKKDVYAITKLIENLEQVI